MTLSIAFVTHKGLEKYSINQDALLIDGKCYAGTSMEKVESMTCNISEPKLFAVSDGVGSTPHAHKASEKVLTFLQSSFETCTTFQPVRVTRNIQESMANLAIAKPEFRGMAATLAGVHINREKATVFNTGDSRVYLMREEKITQLSKDHTQAQCMLDNGEISEERFAELSDIYSMLEGYLVAGELDEEDIPVDISKFTLRERDMLLLCSDGVSDVLHDDEIGEILGLKVGTLKRCEKLFQKVYTSAVDNISMIIVEVG